MKFIVIDIVLSDAILSKHVLFYCAMYEDYLSAFMQVMGLWTHQMWSLFEYFSWEQTMLLSKQGKMIRSGYR